MNKTIADAYKALKGDLNNLEYYYTTDNYLYCLDDLELVYVTFENKHDDYQYICTVEEFNNYKESNMIKFDLEKALAGDKVVTRDGRDVTQLHRFLVKNGTLARSLGSNDIFCAVIDGYVGSVTVKGVYSVYSDGDGELDLDLFMAPKKLSGFVVGFATDDGKSTFSNTFATKEAADDFASNGVHKTYCIDLSTIEQGHGL